MMNFAFGVVSHAVMAGWLWLLLLILGDAVNAASIPLVCDPCIERTDYNLKAIVHGTKGADFWAQMKHSMEQAAKDMRVGLEMELYDTFDPEQMAKDILTVLDDQDDFDVLIVTIPTEGVKDAVQQVIEGGVPVFGFNSGYEFAQDVGVLTYVAMDDYIGGETAARKFLEVSNYNISKALFVNHHKGNNALDLRGVGLANTLALNNSESFVEEVSVDLTAPESQIIQELGAVMEGCPFDAVLLAGTALLGNITKVYYERECNFEKNLLATFDTNLQVYDAIAVRKVAFTISQQHYIQAAATVVLAATFATTGKTLAPSGTNQYGTYLSGPKVVTLSGLPTDTQQQCEADGFPVCSPDVVSTTKCECIERKSIRIGGVFPDPDLAFWGPLWVAARQAADDMNIELLLDPLDRPDDLETENAKTAQKIISLCQTGVDGLFTTIKGEEVVDAIEFCQSLNIPVVSLNSGAAASEELGLMQHISQIEYSAGYAGGQDMAKAGFTTGYCINWHLSNDLDDRCFGFRDAIEEHNITYVGVLAPPNDNFALFKAEVEAAVGFDGDWEGVGFMCASRSFVEPLLNLQVDHPKLLVGTFDTNDIVFQGLDTGNVLFGIDQQPYFQGYLPIPLLTWFKQTQQRLLTHFMETGPRLVKSSPKADEATCEANDFAVCPEPIPSNKNHIGSLKIPGFILVGIIFSSSIGFMIWVLLNWNYRIVKASQPVFLLGICLGAFVTGSTIIPLSLDDGVLEENGGCVGCECRGCDIACMSAPWLFTVGFTLIFAALFSKIWRINRLMASAQRFRRITVTVVDVIVPLAILLLLNVVCMIIWTTVDPMHFKREQRCGFDEYTSFGSCHVGRKAVSVAMAGCVAGVNSLAVLLASYQAFKARNISTDFSESQYVVLAVGCILQILMIGVPLVFLVGDNPQALFFVMTGIITVTCMSVLLLIFVPKMTSLRKFQRSRSENFAFASMSVWRSRNVDSQSRNTHSMNAQTTGRSDSDEQNELQNTYASVEMDMRASNGGGDYSSGSEYLQRYNNNNNNNSSGAFQTRRRQSKGVDPLLSTTQKDDAPLSPSVSESIGVASPPVESYLNIAED